MQHPVYIPSKGRADAATTPHLFEQPVRIVVEAPEADAYRAAYPDHTILVLPFQDRGAVAPARQCIKEHAAAQGHTFHWMLDDNIRSMHRVNRGELLDINAADALGHCERFVHRYTNIDIAGLRHTNWALRETKPFTLNVQVYCAMLVRSAAPHAWRGPFAEDTDYSLQVLAAGRCTLRFNAFAIQKAQTMSMEGGNTDMYRADGKLKMVRTMQRRWPHVVGITRRHGVPRMQVAHLWKYYDTPLERA